MLIEYRYVIISQCDVIAPCCDVIASHCDVKILTREVEFIGGICSLFRLGL